MIKGWRNDPRWVEIHERRERERTQREIQRVLAEMAIDKAHKDMERSMRRLAEPRPVANIDWGY